MADLPTKLTLTVVTRERKILETEVDEVELPATRRRDRHSSGPHAAADDAEDRTDALSRRHRRVNRLVLSWGFAEVSAGSRDRSGRARRPASARSTWPPRKRSAAQAEKELQYLSSHDPEFAVVEARLEESVAMIGIGREH